MITLPSAFDANGPKGRAPAQAPSAAAVLNVKNMPAYLLQIGSALAAGMAKAQALLPVNREGFESLSILPLNLPAYAVPSRSEIFPAYHDIRLHEGKRKVWVWRVIIAGEDSLILKFGRHFGLKPFSNSHKKMRLGIKVSLLNLESGLIVFATQEHSKARAEIMGLKRVQGVAGTIQTLFMTPYYSRKQRILKEAFVFPYYPNGTLARGVLLNRFSSKEKIRIAYMLSAAVSRIHQLGLSHNDLKGDNVLLDENDEPIVCDFGLSSAVESRQKHVRGTVGYFPAEVIPAPLSDRYRICRLHYKRLKLRKAEEAEGKSKVYPDAFLTGLGCLDLRLQSLKEGLTRQEEEMYEMAAGRAMTLAKNDLCALGFIIRDLFCTDSEYTVYALTCRLSHALPEKRVAAAAAARFFQSMAGGA